MKQKITLELIMAVVGTTVFVGVVGWAVFDALRGASMGG